MTILNGPPQLIISAVIFSLGMTTVALAAPPAPAELAARVDQHLAAKWHDANVHPAPLAEDSVYVRRIHLDLVGRIPTAGETRQFLDDHNEHKRVILADRLLMSAAHARHAATIWRRQWVPQSDLVQSLHSDEIESWLAAQVRAGTGFDQVVRELLVAVPKSNRDGAPTAFLAASEFKPENLAANSTRAFLGLNLDCAQCHDHPFARWTRDQFWETAAFFNRPATTETQPVGLAISIPGSSRTVTPRFLAGASPTWPTPLGDETGRNVLASWITSKQNPFFARNLANRVWAQLFGIGLVEPLDDLNHENPPSHPELLDELAQSLIEQDFNLNRLIQSLVMTNAYQRSSHCDLPTVAGLDATDDRLFVRFGVRGLTGEQLYDSLRTAAGMSAEREDLDPQNASRERSRFAERFRIERTSNAQRSILQSLSLMNGSMMSELADIGKSPTLRAIAETPFLDSQGRIEALFLATISRPATNEERELYVTYIDQGSSSEDSKSRLADIFWALLNSAEFSTNH
ncbi:DUF1553 domain-containing protein [Schlesneria paludicola]|uniref:DUF1553 domain-containing protein n=1 Tax=Schlesneria paludicola TaxID=360056 RepID=UPI00029A201A|nr:DUF1553 domain-containing protein [Schlesneria paludicola]